MDVAESHMCTASVWPWSLTRIEKVVGKELEGSSRSSTRERSSETGALGGAYSNSASCSVSGMPRSLAVGTVGACGDSAAWGSGTESRDWPIEPRAGAETPRAAMARAYAASDMTGSLDAGGTPLAASAGCTCSRCEARADAAASVVAARTPSVARVRPNSDRSKP